MKNTEKISKKDIPNTPEPIENADVRDSENTKIDDIKNILNIPMENVEEKVDSATFNREDPFGGVGGSEPLNDDLDDLGLDAILDEDGEGIDSLFEDSEALAEMCVEILDLGMVYTAQAISTEWGQDEKYSIPESRKRKLRKPLQKLLQKRAPKVSPELAFMVFVLALYSPQLIKAWQVRRKKKNELLEKQEPKPMRIKDEPIEPPTKAPDVFRPPTEDDEADEYEAILREMRSKSSENKPVEIITDEKPKRRGRPKGSKDKTKRKPKTSKAISEPKQSPKSVNKNEGAKKRKGKK
tara:strand:- start:296 stop:1183 length:888 start_codon:yes stop_codon:yes gene_type:complete